MNYTVDKKIYRNAAYYVILFSDTHFGIRQNSVTWLDNQTGFFKKEIMPLLKKIKKPVYVIHCGDFFDSRSSINPLVLSTVNKIVDEIRDNCKTLALVCGNHDFYNKENSQISVPDILFHDKAEIYSRNIAVWEDKQMMFIPWYDWEDKNIIRDKILKHGIKYIFGHTDIFTEASWITKEFPEVKIFSGHLHFKRMEPDHGLYNIGAAQPLTFNDANQERGFYVLAFNKNNDIIDFTFMENKIGFKFWKFSLRNFSAENVEIIGKNDYIQLYVTEEELCCDNYNKILKAIKKKTKNIYISPYMSKTNTYSEISNETPAFINIVDFVIDNCPDKLRDKLNFLIKQFNNEQ